MPGEGFKALADPTRRRILELLREGNCTAGELAEHFDISKPSLSHHLATLKNAGLVTDERHGQSIVYSLNTTVMQDLIGWFMSFTNKMCIRDRDHDIRLVSSMGGANKLHPECLRFAEDVYKRQAWVLV